MIDLDVTSTKTILSGRNPRMLMNTHISFNQIKRLLVAGGVRWSVLMKTRNSNNVSVYLRQYKKGRTLGLRLPCPGSRPVRCTNPSDECTATSAGSSGCTNRTGTAAARTGCCGHRRILQKGNVVWSIVKSGEGNSPAVITPLVLLLVLLLHFLSTLT